MAAPSTKQVLLSLVDDVEIISKELIELIASPKAQKADDIDSDQLLELLIEKDTEIKETLKTAKEQEELQKKYDLLKAEVDKRDQEIKHLQQSLKEAESILSTAIYQAKKKLKSINQASQNKISSEELIKYAHKISASNAVVAPPTWAPGDPRRPYPIDIDMRHGMLARLNDYSASHPASSAQTLSEALGHSRPQSQLEQALNAPLPGQMAAGLSSHLTGSSVQPPPPPPPSYQWQSSLDSSHSSSNVATPLSSQSPRGAGLIHLGAAVPGSVSGLHTASSDHHKSLLLKEPDDIEMMSSDSSSSSSSDE